MKVESDGFPKAGLAPRQLGVRTGDRAPYNDVAAISPDDPVDPGTGGMSVAPNDPLNLPREFRPKEFGGVGKEPVWVLNTDELPPELVLRQDKPTHGMVEPSATITLAAYQLALESTREKWKLVIVQPAGGQP